MKPAKLTLTRTNLQTIQATLETRIEDLEAFHDNYRLRMSKDEADHEIKVLEELHGEISSFLKSFTDEG